MHALTDNFMMTIHSDDIYKDACVCEQIMIEAIDGRERF